ncbi:hypothetical protein DWU98_15245 [Dyella monticola]|uniref:Uncharacterized protein n=1 Tax=Dyella monticola TaxID=1927958 RepID=A0A370WVS2_9GAMM|nr:hypothetical protein [Dyella monticola]RDS80258.1 hypothetical protein DWU98_15245 [Dyella monticola]
MKTSFLKHWCMAMIVATSCSYFLAGFCQDSEQIKWPVIPRQTQINDVWSKFVVLISRKGGYVTQGDFENAFHMKFKGGNPTRNNGMSYRTHQGKDWLLTADLTSETDGNESSSSLGIDFKGMGGDQSGKNPCLATKKVFDDLRKKGWSGGYDENMTMVKMASPNGSYQAIVHYSRDCIYSVLVGKQHFWR